MAHEYSRVGFNSSVEVNEVNLSLSYGGVCPDIETSWCHAGIIEQFEIRGIKITP